MKSHRAERQGADPPPDGPVAPPREPGPAFIFAITWIHIAIAALSVLCIVLSAAILVAVVTRSDPVAELTRGWDVVDTDACEFRCPPTMEVRRADASKAAVAAVNRKMGIDFTADTVLQPRGLDAMAPHAFDSYARVLISTEQGTPGSFPTQTDSQRLSDEERRDVESLLREMIEQQMSTLGARSPAGPTRITEWKPVRVSKLGNRFALTVEYKRQMGSNQPVSCRSFIVFDSDRVHHVTVSFREAERTVWAADLEAMLKTFRFK